MAPKLLSMTKDIFRILNNHEACEMEWQVGDKYYILYCILIKDMGSGEFRMKWSDGTETTEKSSPCSEWRERSVRNSMKGISNGRN
jgi:hypothetical protein